MKLNFKMRVLSFVLTLVLILPLCACTAHPDLTASVESTTRDLPVKATLGGVSLSEYVIVHGENALDYTVRAASYLRDRIYEITGALLPTATDATAPTAHEIVVGETTRPISAKLNEETVGTEFSLLAGDGHVALEGEYFVIAAAAYYFIETYITSAEVAASVPAEPQVLSPIVKEAKNFIFLIGDGMGQNHTAVPERYDGTIITPYSDGENLFYGKLLPHCGTVSTDSLSGTTDSAASATALATGHKTENRRIGRDRDGNDLLSLTELAGSLGMNTAVMSTETTTGATPAAFSSHAKDRNDTADIQTGQNALKAKYKTQILEIQDLYTAGGVAQMEQRINNTLKKLNQGEQGFFVMYEEAHIDKHSHNNTVSKTVQAVFRFNQAIGCFMEFAFYNPETFVLITADHETGNFDGLEFHSTSHTGKDVFVFAYGQGTEVFHGKEIENVQIPKTIAAMWGQSLAPETDTTYPPLK